MIYPDLPKLQERRERLHSNRKYYLKVSEVYAMLRTQRGFAEVPGHKLRAFVRKHLTDQGYGGGRDYLSYPGCFHRPECDEQCSCGTYGYDPNWIAFKVSTEGARVVTRYSEACAPFIANYAPFCCPMCKGDKNPLTGTSYQLPSYWQEEQLVCLKCWEKLKKFAYDSSWLNDLDGIIKKLNKEIDNAQKRRTERRKAAKQLGNQGTERYVRHPGSENVANQSL